MLLLLKPTTVVNQDLFECIQGVKTAIDERGIGELPQVLGRLEFR